MINYSWFWSRLQIGAGPEPFLQPTCPNHLRAQTRESVSKRHLGRTFYSKRRCSPSASCWWLLSRVQLETAEQHRLQRITSGYRTLLHYNKLYYYCASKLSVVIYWHLKPQPFSSLISGAEDLSHVSRILTSMCVCPSSLVRVNANDDVMPVGKGSADLFLFTSIKHSSWPRWTQRVKSVCCPTLTKSFSWKRKKGLQQYAWRC